MKKHKKFAADFLYYLRCGMPIRLAWSLAKVTL